MRAIARSPDERFASAESMGAALERFAGGGDLAGTRPVPVTAVQEAPAPPPARSAIFRSWMLVPLMLFLVAAAVTAGLLAIGRLDLGGQPEPTPRRTNSARAIPIATAEDFDPDGDGSEHPQETGLAIDRRPDTAWSTDGYERSPDFGGLGKDGVGLWLDFGRPVRVQQVSITSPLPGWAFELKPEKDAAAPPIQAVDGRTSFQAAGGEPTVIDVPSVQTTGVMIWITNLAPSEEGNFRARISEVTVTGTQG
jgi:hypothetical protein